MPNKIDRETLTGYCVAGLFAVAIIGAIRGVIAHDGGVALIASATALGIVVWLLEQRR